MESWISTLIKNNTQTLLLMLIVVFGAFVHATAMLKLRRDKGETMDKVDFFILLPISMFSGFMFSLGAHLITDNIDIIMLSSGAGAFLGLAGLSKFSDSILNILIENVSKNKSLKTNRAEENEE